MFASENGPLVNTVKDDRPTLIPFLDITRIVIYLGKVSSSFFQSSGEILVLLDQM